MNTNHIYAVQNPLPMLKAVCPPRLADLEVVAALPTFRSAIRYAINHSGVTQDDLAQALRIDPPGFCRMIREPRHEGAKPRAFPHEKLGDFCLLTGSLAPIQWLAFHSGHTLVAKTETRIQQLTRELAAERARSHMADAEVA